MLSRETRVVRIMGPSPQLGVDGELCFQWQDPIAPHFKADLWHLLPSNQLRLAHLETEVQKSLSTSCHSSGVGALVCSSGNPGDPFPESCPSEGLPAIHSSTGSAVLPGLDAPMKGSSHGTAES